tara:strand:- start:267 stop:596 length:330 start_codon:yes stop_codon:yes gene_type:complete
MDELPIDVWANVARFMSQGDRITAFYALKKLGIIPLFHSEHETMMRFLEVGAEYDKSNEYIRSTVHDVFNKLIGMGFEKDEIVYVLDVFGDDVYSDIDFLIEYMLKLKV